MNEANATAPTTTTTTSPSPSSPPSSSPSPSPSPSPAPAQDGERERARALLRDMIRIRRFEARCAEEYGKQKIRGFLHLYDGQEAIAVAFARHLVAEDAVVATYREHGQALARGLPARDMMAELFGKAHGSSRGRGGSMHIFDAGRRFYGGNAIVGGGIPLAVGLALADRMQGRANVTACFFGEGATDEGVFFESLNLAALWRLPVLFICENNLYSMGMAFARAEAATDLVAKARALGVDGVSVDGNDALALNDRARELVARVRAGAPMFVECRTYRFRPHSMFDAQLYRDRAEVEANKRERDPITNLAARAVAEQWLSEADVHAIERDADAEAADAVAFAESAPLEPLADLLRDVGAQPREGGT